MGMPWVSQGISNGTLYLSIGNSVKPVVSALRALYYADKAIEKEYVLIWSLIFKTWKILNFIIMNTEDD